MQISTLATDDLGDRSYLAHDGHTAVVIDPQRDLDRVEAMLDDAGVSVALVLETHIHNDYVTGGYALASRTGASYGVNAADPVTFERLPISDGQRLAVGSLEIEVVATPGHTDTHLSYVVADTSTADDPCAVFTGGSMLYSAVGRTDLLGADRTRELTRAQFRSVNRLARLLPDAVSVHPTHGFGSFCSAGGAPARDTSTIGRECSDNPALRTPDEEHFVEELIAGLGAYPSYYARMGPLNRTGPDAAHLHPPKSVGSAELIRRVANGEWIVDLRQGKLFSVDHLAGSISIASGGQFATTVGWLLPPGAPLTVIADTSKEVAVAQRQLTRIGLDLDAAAPGLWDDVVIDPGLRNSYPCCDFTQLAARPAEDAVLDVRRDEEYRAAHIADALHIPLHELSARVNELPDTRLWVHCAGGFRSSVAASLLARAGRSVIYIDDDFSHAVELGLTDARVGTAEPVATP